MLRSAFVAALFAIHPLHVESVAWIAERKDVLSTFFWLLTLWAYVQYTKHPSIKKYVPVVFTFALGLMSKPMLVSLPLILLLLDFWPLGRLRRGWTLVWEKAPLFAMSAASSVITFIAQRHGNTVRSLEAYPMSVRIGNAYISYVSYLVKMVFPGRLAVIYPYPQSPLGIWKVVGAVLFFICISVLSIRTWRRYPYLAVGWLWYVVTLIPVIGLVQVGFQAMADRYTYVPLVGIFIIIAWGIPDLFHCERTDVGKSAVKNTLNKPKHKRQPVAPYWQMRNLRSSNLAVLACIVVLILTICAYRQVGYWRDTISLMTHATAVTTGNYIAHTNLGEALIESGDPDRAAEHFVEAIRINPMSANAHTSYGNLLLEDGKVDEAIQHFLEAVKIDSGSAYAHYNLGNALGRKQRYAEAIDEYLQAVRIDAEFAEAYDNMGIAEAARGRADTAADCFSKAARIKPDSVDILTNFGALYLNNGNFREAIPWFIKALDIKPDLATAHQSLATAFFQEGEYAKAWREIALCRNYGLEPNSGLLQMLSQKMTEPQ
jgi:tetratricopeptide (TPR) repeat protein